MKLLAVLAGYLGPWVWAAVLGLLVVSHATVGLWVRAELTERHALEKAAAAAAHEKALRIEQAKQKQLSDRWQDIVDRVTGERDAARATIEQKDAALAAQESRLRDALRTAGGLRDQLARYANGSAAGADPGATCEARLRALAALAADSGELLAEGAGLVRSCAAAHDKRAVEVDTLTRGWPVTGPGDDG